MPLPGRRGAPVDWMLVGLGNPGSEYERTRHNIGFEIARALIARWDLPKAKTRYRGVFTEGRIGPGQPRVAVLMPQTYMNDAGRSAGPARGELRVELDHVLVLHDEIDLPFGEIRVRTGGDFARVRVGVGRPPTTDPELVAAYVLGRFREPPDEVSELVERAADEAERVVRGEHEPA
jgi:PTH1 family peptidyl-tRNA hydrolase